MDCLLNRIARSASGDAPEGYIPLPHAGPHSGLSALTLSPEYSQLLRQIRDDFLHPGDQYRSWIPILFAIASDDFGPPALGVLDEWVESGSADRIIAAAALVEDAGHKFVVDKHAFVAHLISCATRQSPDCLDRVRAQFRGSALSEGFYYSPGQPPQEVNPTSSTSSSL